jgi:hypothetical protein
MGRNCAHSVPIRDGPTISRFMALVHQDVLRTTVFLFPSVEDATRNTRAGGTGFLIGVPNNLAPPYEDGSPKGSTYLVTAAHVVEKGVANVARVNTPDGGWHSVLLDGWVTHPDGDDVAACQIGSEWKAFDCASILYSTLATQDVIEQWSIGPGDDVFLVGRFVGHQGQTRNRPVVRFGHIAMLPAERIRQPERDHDQLSYLVEVLSVSGFSGSPVFATVRAGARRRGPQGQTINLLSDAGPFLIGVDWGHLTRDALIETLGFPYHVHSGMTGVVPAEKIRDVLFQPSLVEQRATARD